ncbi:enoyl-CoA hydratase-related protein, partial [Marinobacter alexandrii]|uniref:enoyl-CoA hydratase-related protein n=1 Tax=Marinobacter alexandrii TaxID=2570351 RepID=UPI00329826EA
MTDEVLTSQEDGILTITLNRPKAKNAANKALSDQVAAAMDELESNDSLRVAILTGAGGTFCSGMDLKAFVTGETPFVEGRGFAGLTEYRSSKPIIAAVEGYALAGGFELAISCDMIVAADDSMFGIPEVKRGLAAAAGGLVKLPRQISPRIAM